MKMRFTLTIAALALVLLAAAQPASAQLNNKKYTVDFFGSHINAPFDLVFMAVDCVEFVSETVFCAPLVFEDCGPYEITEVDGTTIHFEASANFAVGTLILGKVDIHGVVDRDGAGSSMAMSFSGKLRSPDLDISATRTNGSAHGVNGCDVMVSKEEEKPRWVKKD